MIDQPVRREPWVHTWTDEDGIKRQAKIHYTRDDRSVVWDPRWLGDEEPWFDSDTENWRCGDEDLVTLGDPSHPEFGLVDPDPALEELEDNACDSTEAEETGSVLTRYRVTWTPKGRDEPRTNTSVVDSAEMTRPGDPEQRDQLLRIQLWSRLADGPSGSDSIVLLDVVPLCNCGPYPEPANCLYAEHKGVRFHLVSTEAEFEVIGDRHGDKTLGIVHNTLSVQFLTLSREQYGHQ
ncbi:hypothetical protein [Streptomyces chattanoogensis]|uniref:hypothetical protein n=1 Tax=Streptomyces chattanoogensis TaxID=66876 RepID=UPI0036D04948